MLALIIFVFSLIFQTSFRFFFWLLCVEIIMVNLMLFSTLQKSSIVYISGFLVLGACEVGTALVLMVKVTRFSGLEKTTNLQCEGF